MQYALHWKFYLYYSVESFQDPKIEIIIISFSYRCLQN